MINYNSIDSVKALMCNCLKCVDGTTVKPEDIDVLPYGDGGLWVFHKGELIGRYNNATVLFESFDKEEFYFASKSSTN